MKIFISYRRDDSAGYAGRLFDFLSAHFGPRNVFMDIDTIQPGDDFRKVVRNAVGNCDVVVVMIGKQWLNMLDQQGRRRLDDPRDWVQVEIATALANPNVRVIPVLVRGASMPDEDALPASLKELSWRNALELSDTRFQHDASKLIEAIEQAVAKQPQAPVVIPARKPAAAGWAIMIGAVIVCGLLVLAGYGYFRSTAASVPTQRIEITSTSSVPPTFTATVITVESPTGTDTPSIPTSTPVIIPPAADAVNDYYSQVSADHFETTWNLLTDSYKSVHNATGFEPYQKYWSSVDKVVVTNTSTILDDGRDATIKTDLLFYYLDGRVIPIYGYEIKLVYDPARQTWLINDTP